MASGAVMPSPNFQGLLNGLPVAAGLLYTYRAGTLIDEPTYQDADLTIPNTNPIVLSSEGKAVVFLSSTTYKFLLTTADGDIVPPYPVDNIASTQLSTDPVSNTLVEFGGEPDTPITSTSYPVGTTFDKCHAGTRFYPLDAANVSGDYVLSGMLMAIAGVTVTAALVNLSDGSPETPLVTIASSDANGELVTSSVITFPAPGATKTYAIKVKVSVAGVGFAWMLELVKV